MTSSFPATPLFALDAVVLDTETTGLDPNLARPVQIGALRVRQGSVRAEEQFEALIDPGQPIPPETTAIHRITDADVAGAPDFAAVAPALAAFLGNDLVIGHTIGFDLEILRRAHERAGITWAAPAALDVRSLARLAAPDLARDDLDGLCAWLGIAVTDRHSAIGDARMTASVYLALLPRLRQRGIRTLAEAEAGLRRLAEREARARGAVPVEPVSPPPASLMRIDSFPYRHRVADVMNAPPLFASPASSLKAAIALLTERGVSSLFSQPAHGPEGIVTERDILRALATGGAAALDRPIGEIASSPVQSVLAGDFVYRAIGRMQRLNLRHLAVRDGEGAIVGALTPRNLLRQRASTALALGDAIDSAADNAALAQAWARLVPMAQALLAEELDAPAIAAVISEELRALTRRAAELAEERMREEGQGPPPVAYCVLVLGSAGRGESLLGADQDNAIVFASGEPDGVEDRWFAAMAGHMNETMDAVGVRLCPGGVMARKAAWRQSRDGWFARVEHWVRRQKPEDLLHVDIFFDLAPVHGDLALGEAVRARALAAAHAARDFQLQLAAEASKTGSPFTLLRRIRADEQGRADLKRLGLLPIVNAARVLAIRHGVAATGTVARWRAVEALGVGAASDIAAVIEAHRVILTAMLAQQIADIEAGAPPSARVRVRGMARLARPSLSELAEALGQVGTATDLMREGRI